MIPQTSEQWLPARVGLLTASVMGDVVGRQPEKLNKDGSIRKGSGEYYAARANLRNVLAAERWAGLAADNYVSRAMRDGIEREPTNKKRFMVETGLLIRPGGLVMHPTIEFFGATPDGFIDHDALFEAKCPTHETFLEWLQGGVVPPEHEPQMLAQLACTGRRRVYFSAYFPVDHAEHRWRPDARRVDLFVRMFEPPRERIDWIEGEARAFLKEVDAAFEWIVMNVKEEGKWPH